MRLAEIAVYPVKGARAVRPDEAVAEERGLAGDRRAMLVGEGGGFLSQRNTPALARLDVTAEGDGFTLSAEDLYVRATFTRDRADVTVWDSTLSARLADGDTNAALSAWLDAPVRLVCMDEGSRRAAKPKRVPGAPQVSLADASPILIATTASLNALNEAMDGPPVPMERFRPNLVVETDEPWAEDRWARIGIGDTVLDVTSPCDRCKVTTLDQATGEATGKEPLATLARLRRSADEAITGVLFGWNAALVSGGPVRVGDEVEVLARREGGWPLRPTS